MDYKVPQEELMTRLDEAAKRVNVGAEYMHYKQRRLKVICLAVEEATNEIAVVYQALYDEHVTFIRPLKSWLEAVEVEGQQVPRFARA